MIKFGQIEYLYLLACIPILILLLLFYTRWQNKNLSRFSTPNLRNELSLNKSYVRRNIKYILRVSSILFLIIGISNPKIGTNIKEIKRKGIEIVIALDVSNSMLCEDIKPNRLSRSIQAISGLIDKLEGDKIGLVIFAGESYTQLPITSDYAAAKMFLSTISTNSIKKQGTSISRAIEQSMISFDFNNEYNKSIIILTDGEDHEDGALDSAREAAKQGVFIHTLSIGEEGGGPIPISNKRGQKTGEFKKDVDGNIIVTKPNIIFLTELANTGNGININGNNSNIGLRKLFNEISKIEKKEISDSIFTDYTDRFQIFLFISIILLMLDLIIIGKKNNILKRFAR